MKSIWMVLLAIAGTASVFGSSAVDAMTTDPDLEMTALSVKPRYPWSGKVDIDFAFTSTIPEAFAFVNFTASYKDKDGNTVNVPMKTFDQFTTAFCTNAGTYHVTWDSVADAPGLTVTNLKYSVTANMAKYMVVDMAKGTAATPEDPYPVSYLEECPDPTRDDGGWTDEYKTTKMVFRLVQPGTFKMGWSSNGFSDWNDGMRHDATLTRPYYLAIFECTQGQLKQFTGSYVYKDYQFTGGRRDLRPNGAGSFRSWRGANQDGYCWPNHGSAVSPTSWLGIFRQRTGSDCYDIPTETEWEFAARAGSTDAWGGDGLKYYEDPDKTSTGPTGAYTNSLLSTIGRYKYNGGFIDNGDGTWSEPAYTCDETHGTAIVGSYKPNAWGFYDMLGNVQEFVLDKRAKMTSSHTYDDQGPACDNESIPATVTRTMRGGRWNLNAKSTSIPSRSTPDKDDYLLGGARICWHFPYPCKTE